MAPIPTQSLTDEQQKIRMYRGQVRQALSSLAAALARLAGLTDNPFYALLSKTADTWREELDKVVK